MSRMKWVFCCAVVAASAVAARISAEDLFGALEGPSDDAPTASGVLHPEDDSEGEMSVASGASTRRRENEARIEAILDQPLKTPLIFADTPLDHLIDVVSDDYDVQIVIDRAAFDALALSPEVEITVSLRNITLRSAFDLLLSATPSTEDLTFLVDDEVLLITSKDVAESRLQVRVYRVDDLIRDDVNGRLDFDSLTDLIIATVAQDSWAENGTGEGEVRSLPPGILVVSQTRRVQHEVTQLLAEIRSVKSAIESQDRATQVGSDQAPATTKAIRIENVWGDSPERSLELIRETILRSVEWEGAHEMDEEERFLAILPDRVIVRHRPVVVAQIDRLLRDLDYAKPRRGGGFGGGGASPGREPVTASERRQRGGL